MIVPSSVFYCPFSNPVTRSDQVLLESNVLRQANPDYYVKKTNVESSGQLQLGTHQHGEEYTTLAYERSMQHKVGI